MTRHEDRICLNGIQASTIIGVYDWERQVRQNILLDLELTTDISRGASSDKMEDTLDYKQVCKELTGFVEGSSFMLLETLAEEAAALILDRFPVQRIQLKVCKQWALRQVKDVSIVITREGKK